MSDEIETFDERRERREARLLGRDRVRPANDAEQMAEAAKMLGEERAGETEIERGDLEYRLLRGDPAGHKSFKNEGAAHAMRSAQRAEQAERQAEQRRKEQSAQRLEREHAPRKAAAWTQQEQQQLAAVQERANRYEQAVQQYENYWEDQVTDEERRQVEAVLGEELATLQQAQREIQQAAAQKQLQAGRSMLPESLQDKDTRERFIEWAERQGVPRSMTVAETDPSKIGVAFRKFQEHEREQGRKAKQAKVAEHGQRQPRVGSRPAPRNSDDARKNLRESGSVRDAVSVLAMKRAEKLL